MKENGSLTCLKWDASRRVASAASTHRVGLAFWSYFQNPCIQRSLCVIFFLRWPDTFHPLPLLPSISRRFSKIFSRTVSFSTFSFTLSCLDRSTIDQRTTNVRSIYRTGSVKQIFRAGGGGRKIKARKAGKMYAGRSATAHWSVNADESYAIPIDRLAPTIITTIEPTTNAIGNDINSSLASGTLFVSRSRSFFTPLCETIVRNALSHLCRKVETAATVRTPAQRR